jgi:hypothetical protein
MIRTQVQLSEDQLQALKARALQENISVSELVRRAIDAWTKNADNTRASELRRRAANAVGRFASGKKDVAQHHDEYLSQAYKS